MSNHIFKLAGFILLATALCLSSQNEDVVTNSSNIEDYKTPKDCNAYYTTDFSGVALECEVDFIDEGVSLAAIPTRFTQSLNLTCKNSYVKSSLANLSFSHLTELRQVEILNCQLNILPRATLNTLTNTLSYLGVKCNYKPGNIHLIIEDSAIGQLKLLRALDLADNDLSSFPEGELCQNPNLQVLNLSSNYFQNLSVLGFGGSFVGGNETRACSQNLTILDLSFNRLTHLDSYCFCQLVRLQKLGLQGNLIRTIADNAFSSLRNLTLLDLSLNQIENIDLTAFSELISLRVLNISRNNISNQVGGAFLELKNLEIFDLSYNQLVNMSAEITAGLVKLQQLYLSNNNILTIESNTFVNSPELSFLNIEMNKLETVTNVTWHSLHNLKTVLLNYNNIITFEPNVLQCCTQLESISLTNNKLTIAPNVSMLPKLQIIDLEHNEIFSISEDTFNEMKNIIGISLKANKLTMLPSLLFKDLTNLIILNLSENELETFSTKTLTFLEKMTHLVLKNNKLSAIPNLQLNKNLLYLDVSNNHITLLDYGMFPTSLTYLIANSNRIRNIDTKFFYARNIPLSYLDLSYNQLTRLWPTSIPTTLEYLNMDYNVITNIDGNTFQFSTAIQTVSLIANQIQTINKATLKTAVPLGQSRPQFIFSSNPLVCDCNLWWINIENADSTLETLGVIRDINYLYCFIPVMGKPLQRRLRLVVNVTKDEFWCEFQNYTLPSFTCAPGKIDNCVGSCPDHCYCYNSYTWSKTKTFCSDANLTSIPRGIPMSTVEMHLDGNEIHLLNDTSFEIYSQVQVLYLNGSQVQTIRSNTFAKMTTLQVLHLENNELVTLTSGTFAGLTSLTTLLLFSNNLSNLEEDLFVSLASLDVLQLQDNKLTTFPVWVLESTPSLERISLGSNPWSCDCKYVDKYRDWLQRFANKITDSEKLECRIPSDQVEPDTTLPLIAFNASYCMAADMMHVDANLSIIISVICAFVSLITFGVLAFSYRHEIQVLIYSRYGVRLRFIHPLKDPCDDKDKQFDAFIAYSNLDDVFVAHELLPGLENGEHPFKLCLHHRNFLVGGVITNSILEAIECSRRTIVIMSDNFAESNWCRFEFKSAHLKMMEDRCQRLIMIVLGDITADLDEEVKLYLKTNTYLKWGDKLFWQKLYYAMPDRPT